MLSPSGSLPSFDLTVRLGRLTLPNPILVASGTFGYAREMERIVDLSRLGGILPKTVTKLPRPGNAPWRTVETSSGMLNAIGLDNDGIDCFIEKHVPYLRTVGCPVIASIAGRTIEEFYDLAAALNDSGLAAIELNISCPNVSGGVDFGTAPDSCRKLVQGVRDRCSLPIIAKLTPNVTRIVDIAQAAEEGGADAVSAINTLLGMAIDWRRKKPMLGNTVGGLSGPAIKPVALRCVHQIRQATKIPIIGIGGISCLDDVMEFFVAGATAIQLGTVNYFDPLASMRILDELPAALAEAGAGNWSDIVGTLKLPSAAPAPATAPV